MGDGVRPPVEHQGRRPAIVVDDLDVPEVHACPLPRAEGLHHGLLGGKACGQALVGASRCEGVLAFGGGEDAIEEAIPVAGADLGDPRDLDQVHAVQEHA